ncbi:purine nucleoside permease [Novosphingobium sp. 1949]|uniref:Purine nucleoside permease n=1 Tax=Novosphingobium organovorum TaxID=2930092 RepID=A0ABT0BG08_9SPHN|nr:purine nucleoside permease [Novosphingobium organovorum]MCJ2183956.1 purine nucleoside permease [Novosphingobium organovorum]
MRGARRANVWKGLAFAGLAGLTAVMGTAAPATEREPAERQPQVPELPKLARIPVKVIVVANFEPGADTGDAPGEYQLWAEREHLSEAIAVPGLLHPLNRNAQGLYGVVWGNSGSLLGGVGEQLTALLLDPRFDFTHTYWLFTGISGVDPEAASVGSAAWARWVVSGDTLREFDDREIPNDWPYGLFAIGADRPGQLPGNANSFAGMTDVGALGMTLPLNAHLADWAFAMTKDVVIPDNPALAKARARWTGYPNAQKPPFVLEGETLGALRYWHGPGRTQWARDWVRMWTGGKGRFVMTNMESQTLAGAMLNAAKEGRVDLSRMMVLRTASNPSMPPPGVSAADTVGDEGPGQDVAYEANYRVGVPVVHELLRNWDRYKDHVPGDTAPGGAGQ